MKKTLRVGLLVGLFLFSFVLFLVLTFPYEVLKESLAAELSQQTGYKIRIGELAPNLPLGLEARKIRIDTANGSAGMSVDGVTINLGIFPMLLGRFNVNALIEQGAGELDAAVNFSVFDLIARNFVPKSMEVDSQDFPLDQFAAFGLASAANNPNANPMVTPILSAVGISGMLNSKMDFDFDSKNPTQSTGQLEITLKNAILKLSHPSLGLPDQAFNKAMIKANVQNGTLLFDPNSGFVSDELSLLVDGKITLKPQPTASQLDTKIQVKLDKGLKEKFGFIVDAVVGSATSDGQLTMQLRGPLEQPAVTTF